MGSIDFFLCTLTLDLVLYWQCLCSVVWLPKEPACRFKLLVSTDIWRDSGWVLLTNNVLVSTDLWRDSGWILLQNKLLVSTDLWREICKVFLRTWTLVFTKTFERERKLFLLFSIFCNLDLRRSRSETLTSELTFRDLRFTLLWPCLLTFVNTALICELLNC